jgi:hypothetical protein
MGDAIQEFGDAAHLIDSHIAQVVMLGCHALRVSFERCHQFSYLRLRWRGYGAIVAAAEPRMRQDRLSKGCST